MKIKKSGAVTVAAAALIIVLLCAYNLRGGKSDVTNGAVGTESAETAAQSETKASAEQPTSAVTETSAPAGIEGMTVDDIISAVRAMKAGDTVEFAIPDAALDALFYAEPVSEAVEARITGVSYRENDDISLSELRYVRVLHVGFDGKTHVGELIVNEKIADDIVEIMRELYKNGYEIERMLLVDEYGGDDDKSMADNNSSAFNYRTVANTSTLSNHALGMAVDINPLYNPYVTKKGVYPENGSQYADRSLDFRAKIDHEDFCYKLFTAHGFEWGGDWTRNIDYQHFEKAN